LANALPMRQRLEAAKLVRRGPAADTGLRIFDPNDKPTLFSDSRHFLELLTGRRSTAGIFGKGKVASWLQSIHHQ
jgi:hypothetical protein